MFKTLKLKTTSIVLSTIFLSSCQSFPWPSRDAERCALYINPVIIEGREFWEGKCRCHAYRISKKTLGRVSESVDHPVEYCKRLTGFRPVEWTEFFVTWFEEIQIWDNQKDEDLQRMVE